MNLKLEELRKRLLEPSTLPVSPPPNTIYQRSAGVAHHVPAGETAEDSEPDTATNDGPPSESDSEPRDLSGTVLHYAGSRAKPAPDGNQYQVAQAVAKVFEPTMDFQRRLDELSSMFESIERLGQSVTRIFTPVKEFHEQLSRLAQMFEPMKGFQQQLAQMAQTFEPTKALNEQLNQLAEAFQLHLAKLVKALEPAKALQARVQQLADTFEPAVKLQTEFSDLARRLKMPARPGETD